MRRCFFFVYDPATTALTPRPPYPRSSAIRTFSFVTLRMHQIRYRASVVRPIQGLSACLVHWLASAGGPVYDCGKSEEIVIQLFHCLCSIALQRQQRSVWSILAI